MERLPVKQKDIGSNPIAAEKLAVTLVFTRKQPGRKQRSCEHKANAGVALL